MAIGLGQGLPGCYSHRMKHLTATICLTLAVLLGSAGVSFALPPCPSDPIAYYDNCFGTFTFADGNQYVGEWKNNKFNGQGTFTFANGDKYVGEFKDDKRNGQGTYTYADGTVEEGIWKNGEFQYTQKVTPTVIVKKITLENAKQQCAEIGFKKGTEKFGDCVMKLLN